MRCKEVNIEERIICAKPCLTKFNESPIAKFSFEDFVISDASEYFDSDLVSNRQVRWKVYVGDYFFYDFGWHYYNEVNPLGNGSTYGEMFLGDKNIDILAYLSSLPSIFINKGQKLCMRLDVRDDSGIESLNVSNTYCFIK